MSQLDNEQLVDDRQEFSALGEKIIDVNNPDIQAQKELAPDVVESNIVASNIVASEQGNASNELNNELNEAEPQKTQQHVYVCQYRTCKKDGAEKVLAAFLAEDLPNVIVSECGCLGLCGSGPMIVVEPDDVYYWRVRASEVAAIAEHHLRGGEPIPSMLHPRVHPDPQQFRSGN
ncbi:hypothetical protein Pse7367_0470 [Thalassoporum mexicanum PCC 7367]|uniref:(2Fe-2S) ferredoxin domain-containing protein n=1 Tax=Thalassoporum mexicanum TaxID=3457544 RepID=UPI00029FA9FB|nr:(2Fe-2S) ferredoxin domain-containing protein [Pseudanabaena sp. PCC 7367]AFY68780.1 hypothetical protein Pse7367_0470 [Pseudanabaena sp. PCC 7367]